MFAQSVGTRWAKIDSVASPPRGEGNQDCYKCGARAWDKALVEETHCILCLFQIQSRPLHSSAPSPCYKAGEPKLSCETEGGENSWQGRAFAAQQINLIMFGKLRFEC